jgi:hypothetical protein
MASNHSFIQGGVSTLPSFCMGIKKAPDSGSMYEQAIVIISMINQSFFFLSNQTSVSRNSAFATGLQAKY